MALSKFDFNDPLNLDNEYLEPYDLYEENRAGRPRDKVPMLRTQDYNLNSPLIPDESDAAIEFLKNRKINVRFSHRRTELNELRQTPIECGVNLLHIKSSYDHHRRLPDCVYNKDECLVKKNIIKRWKRTWYSTKEILNANFKGLMQENAPINEYFDRFSPLESEESSSLPLRQEWKTFLNINFIIFLMNSNSVEQAEEWLPNLLHVSSRQYAKRSGVYVLGKRQIALLGCHKKLRLSHNNWSVNVQKLCFDDKRRCVRESIKSTVDEKQSR
ncbi:hypothetical protein JTE90_024188 [Oedothorax gibbosus]|uniref:Uncharacterized protein n=1 Tax=Oedothorax gibbosus TaxID=931172 RepID=A0AAV6UFF1_9ARAC|nr:hypothetical protein JTE90_024188 [Oedothorax gibbosus]